MRDSTQFLPPIYPRKIKPSSLGGERAFLYL
jgi:hypothetical protein